VRSSQNAQFQLLITKSKGLTKPGSQAHTNIGSKSLLADAFRKGPYFKFHNLLTSHHLKSVTWYLSSELDYHHDHFTMSVAQCGKCYIRQVSAVGLLGPNEMILKTSLHSNVM
jgi:hypothetical protein